MKYFKVTLDEYETIVEAEDAEQAREEALFDFGADVNPSAITVEEATPDEVIEWESDDCCCGECGVGGCENCPDNPYDDEADFDEWLDDDEEF